MTDSSSPPLVSVVMSVYNGEDFLRESIGSLLDQTFTDFELLILDDASTDSTPQILSDYAKLDRRICLIANERNLGLTKSLNKCLSLTRGEYIARQDADDVSLPERFARQVTELDARPEVAALACWADVIDETGAMLTVHRIPTDHETLRESLLFTNILCHSSLMARRSAFEELGGYDETLRFAQDHKLWWQLAAKGQLAALPLSLVKLRRCPNLTRRYQEEQRRDACRSCLAFIKSQQGELSELEESAFQRFWYSFRHREGRIHAGDIKLLPKVWKLLSPELLGADYWSWQLIRYAKSLIYQGRWGSAGALLAALHREAGLPWRVALWRLAGAFAPNLGLGIGRRLGGASRKSH